MAEWIGDRSISGIIAKTITYVQHNNNIALIKKCPWINVAFCISEKHPVKPSF